MQRVEGKQCVFQHGCEAYAPAAATGRGLLRRRLLLDRLRASLRFAIVAFVCFCSGLLVSISGQQPSMQDYLNSHAVRLAEQDVEAGKMDVRIEGLRVRVAELAEVVAKQAESISVLRSDIATMKGIGIALSAVIGLLQVVQTIVGKALKRE